MGDEITGPSSLVQCIEIRGVGFGEAPGEIVQRPAQHFVRRHARALPEGSLLDHPG